MREILFRGKRVDNGEWVEGGICDYGGGVSIFVVNHYAGSFYEPPYTDLDEVDVVPSTVGQYTGLTDKNGKKIFEGDIIEFTDDVYKRTYKGICVFKDGSYQIKFNYYKSQIAYHRIGKVDVDQDMGASYTICYEYNVIGNVYDNNEMENAE